MAKCDPAFGQIVGREFQRDFVSRQNANAIAAQPACQMGKNDPVVLQLNAEQTARKFLEDSSRDFYAVFLTHSTSLCADGGNQPAIISTFEACKPFGPFVTSNSTRA